MLAFKRLLKRPYQQVLFVVWMCLLCAWLLVGLRRVSISVSDFETSTWIDSHTRWPRQSKQAPMSNGGSYGPNENEVVHPRLHERPMPTHGSQPFFPNIPVAVHLPADDGSHINEEEVQLYIDNIWDLGNSRFWRTECDGQHALQNRYGMLKDLATNHHTSRIKYFFALDLYEVKKLLPRLMGTLVQVVKLLGPEKCAVSIIEGRSKDGTYAILSTLKEKLETINVTVYLEQSSIDPHEQGVDRIGALSELRNMALAPLIAGSKNSTGPPLYNHETIITFINDIALCTEDVFELLFQHVYQGAHQTCSMDWVYGGDLFYDSWVSRSMSGDLFFEVPQDVSFAFAHNMFWDHPVTKRKFEALQPFQVYSCWGGMITLSSGPIIDGQIKIRNSTKDECYAGEPINLAKDLWKLGYGKIATVPTVNVGYNSAETTKIKKRRGWVHKKVDVDKTEEEWQKAGKGTEKVKWSEKPPGQVKCLPGWGVGTWTEP